MWAKSLIGSRDRARDRFQDELRTLTLIMKKKKKRGRLSNKKVSWRSMAKDGNWPTEAISLELLITWQTSTMDCTNECKERDGT